MIYPINQNDRETVEFGGYQEAIILVETQDSEEPITITNEDIVEGGFVIDRASQSGDSLEIGSVIASELALQLNNSSGKFDDINFEGSVMDARVNISGVTLYLGRYIPDEVNNRGKRIILSALDKMAAFDKPVTSPFSFNTLNNVIAWCAVRCGVVYDSPADISSFPNINVSVEYPEDREETITYRQILSWACECIGANAYIDRFGRLCIGWYSDTGVRITSQDRIQNTLELQENPIAVTGLKVSDTMFGNDGYVVQIINNPFAEQKTLQIGQGLYNYIRGFSYTPFSVTSLPMPWLYPMDGGKVDDTDVIITNVTFKLNGTTTIRGRGETITKKNMAAANPLTRRESALVQALQIASRAQTDAKIEQILLMNQLASYAMGLYPHDEQQEDGSWIFTFSDAPELEDSEKVYRFNANGFFVSQDGGQTWTNGLDSEGHLVVHILTADSVVTGTIRDALGYNYWNLDTGELHMAAVDVSIGARNYIRQSNDLSFGGYFWEYGFDVNNSSMSANNVDMSAWYRNYIS